MPCNHKFKGDLNIDYSKTYNPTTLVVGTFNPEWPDNNSANWFYGRIESNYFWNILPKIYNEESLLCSDESKWLQFCSKKKIAITDLIASIKSANKETHMSIISGYSDKSIQDNFKYDELELVPITEILGSNRSIKHVYLTRSAKQGLWKNLWRPIKEYCDENGLSCQELLTPSPYARYQYSKEEKERYSSLSEFIAGRWKAKWHSLES